MLESSSYRYNRGGEGTQPSRGRCMRISYASNIRGSPAPLSLLVGRSHKSEERPRVGRGASRHPQVRCETIRRVPIYHDLSRKINADNALDAWIDIGHRLGTWWNTDGTSLEPWMEHLGTGAHCRSISILSVSPVASEPLAVDFSSVAVDVAYGCSTVTHL